MVHGEVARKRTDHNSRSGAPCVGYTFYFPWPWPLLSAGLLVPRPVRDWLYDRVALNRYALFGRQEVCMVPTPEIRNRFL